MGLWLWGWQGVYAKGRNDNSKQGFRDGYADRAWGFGFGDGKQYGTEMQGRGMIIQNGFRDVYADRAWGFGFGDGKEYGATPRCVPCDWDNPRGKSFCPLIGDFLPFVFMIWHATAAACRGVLHSAA